jgi:hypothetical protein
VAGGSAGYRKLNPRRSPPLAGGAEPHRTFVHDHRDGSTAAAVTDATGRHAGCAGLGPARLRPTRSRSRCRRSGRPRRGRVRVRLRSSCTAPSGTGTSGADAQPRAEDRDSGQGNRAEQPLDGQPDQIQGLRARMARGGVRRAAVESSRSAGPHHVTRWGERGLGRHLLDLVALPPPAGHIERSAGQARHPCRLRSGRGPIAELLRRDRRPESFEEVTPCANCWDR